MKKIKITFSFDTELVIDNVDVKKLCSSTGYVYSEDISDEMILTLFWQYLGPEYVLDDKNKILVPKSQILKMEII